MDIAPNRPYSFYKGRLNEEKCLVILPMILDVKHIHDVREDKEYQKKDIDFILEMRNGSKITIEVKSDAKIDKNSNLLVEHSRLSPDGSLAYGWVFRSEADWLMVRNIFTNKVFFFPFVFLRKRIYYIMSKHPETIKILPPYNNSDGEKLNELRLIPMEYLAGIYYELYNEEDGNMVFNFSKGLNIHFIEDGRYMVELKAEEGTSKNGNHTLYIKARILEGLYKGWIVKDYITSTEKSVWKAKQMLDAIGIKAEGEISIDPTKISGMHCNVDIINGDYINGYGEKEKKNHIKRYLPLDDNKQHGNNLFMPDNHNTDRLDCWENRINNSNLHNSCNIDIEDEISGMYPDEVPF